MKIWCLSDPHLGFGVNKPMDIYGDHWTNHPAKIRDGWRANVSDEDLVIVPGDISWASTPEQLAPDMDFFASLPGTILFGKGNHENWWQSSGKASKLISPNGRLLDASRPHRDGDLAIVGTRMWDNPELRFAPFIAFNEGTTERDLYEDDIEQRQKVFTRELGRLDRALHDLGDAPVRIAALHYPPTTPEFVPTVVTEKLEAAGVQHCVFGHIHSLKPEVNFFGELNGVHYHNCAVDHIDFTPRFICEV